ncbi:isopenicillin-N N-acyltransferase like protein [Anaerolineales bacterium]|nr:isopenicillin-N N-acyltransferase like protein [Anaerolineales bacterium]
MSNLPIPIIEAYGTHREVGSQIGMQCKPQIMDMLSQMRSDLPANVTWKSMLEQSRLYLAYSRTAYPQYTEELEGIAKGSGVPFDEIFLGMCEELWEPSVWNKGCTDMAARGRATLDGSTLLAHTNDLVAEDESRLVILKVQAGDEPVFLAVSAGGVGISAGFNAAKISLTGNQLDSNDIRPGVPRLLVARAILGARHLGEAMSHCLLKERASSYNNIIADGNGEVYSMEGSATDCDALYIEGDILAHANHYVSPVMRRFELDPSAFAGSIIRHNRAMRLLEENYGKLTPDLFKTLLADHTGYPYSICSHQEKSKTVFSIIIQLESLRAWIGSGLPCQTEYIEYRLEPYRSQDS